MPTLAITSPQVYFWYVESVTWSEWLSGSDSAYMDTHTHTVTTVHVSSGYLVVGPSGEVKEVSWF